MSKTNPLRVLSGPQVPVRSSTGALAEHVKSTLFWMRLAAVLLAVSLLGGMIHALITGRKILTIAPQVEAAACIRLDGAMAHLWFEEVISGDGSIPIETVVDLIYRAEDRVRALLGEKKNGAISAPPIQDAMIRHHMAQVLAQLGEFRQIARERLASTETRGIGSIYDQRFDAVFLSFLQSTSMIEEDLQALMARNLAVFQRIQSGLIVLSTLLGIVVTATFVRFERRVYQANQTLVSLSNTDPLTGLANRRAFNEILATEWTRVSGGGQPFSLLMCDLDCFKQYNDCYGHPAGDRCLQLVARTISGIFETRPGNLVARYGGEEIAILMPGTDSAGAAAISEKIQKAVAGLAVKHRCSLVESHLTVSLGVATAEDVSKTTAEILLDAADRALYEAKRQGRNRVQTAQVPQPSTEESDNAPPQGGEGGA